MKRRRRPAFRAGPRTHRVHGVLLAVGSALVVGACAESTRYRVLSFLLDGVPPPGSTPATGYAAPQAGVEGAGGGEPAAAPPLRAIFTHAPYRENACGRCHNPETGQLFRKINDGLCLTCHAALTKEQAFVHGPAAVNECGFCHHPHTAPHAKLLLEEPRALCLQCHEGADLTTGDHHANGDQANCVSCHDPHGGSDRFFLKPKDR